MKKILHGLCYLTGIYTIALVFFSIFRAILFITEYGHNEMADSDTIGLISKAFLIGLRFDTVISCYILILPLLLICIQAFTRSPIKNLYKGIYIWSGFLFSISLILSAANIPYFRQFYKTINASVWNWAGELSFVTGMLLKENDFLLYIILFFIADILFLYLLKRFYRFMVQKGKSLATASFRGIAPICCIIVCCICFLGIRGRIARKSPIRIGTAYFCNNSFLNQLGLNPTFVFLKTSLEFNSEKNKEIRLMDNKQAVHRAAGYLNIKNISEKSWQKTIPASDSLSKKNVVLILMEGFCTQLLDKKDRTPFVNTLINRSIYFPNAFSAGIHTMNGLYSCLFSFPALLNQHPFKNGGIKTYNCWPSTMKENGYHTLYFTTHDDQFDNIGGYLLANQIEQITSQKDYPISEVHSNLGVCDDYMFKRSIPVINKANKDGKPFFATMLTASNHHPIIIPDYYTPKEGDRKDQIVEYADWALAGFFEQASKEPWYKNTIFVLTGDHGSPAGNNLYDVSLSYHQIPLIIYEPGKEDRAYVCENLAGQIDIYPTVMGMLGLPYKNETFGIDLFRENRPYLLFSSDDSYCCVDTQYYYVNRLDKRESLYNYKMESTQDSISYYPEKARIMNDYALSMLQAAQYFVLQKE